MTEPTRKWITQILLPALFLFGGLAFMYGPAYVSYFQKQWLDYRLARDSIFGPEQYDVRLKAGFVSQSGENCLVVVLADKEYDRHSDEPSRQEVILVDSWSRIVQRDLHENVGALQSTHLSPQDGGYAVLEIVRRMPDNHWVSEVARYQVTGERIDPMESEVRHQRLPWNVDRGRGWRERGPEPDPRNWWSRDRSGMDRPENHGRGDESREAFERNEPDRRDRDARRADQRGDVRWGGEQRRSRGVGPRQADQPEPQPREHDQRPPKDRKRPDRDADLARLDR